MAAHEQAIGATDEWYTPPWVFKKLGVTFDLDAASPGQHVVPWVPAKWHLSRASLQYDWFGAVWLNPPYGPRNGIRPWLEKLAAHRNGIALVPNRTGADWWQDFAARSDGLLFVRGKIRFIRPDGSEGASPGYGNVMMAFGSAMAEALQLSEIDGYRA